MRDTDKPLVTFALFAYNQEQYIREAVLGAFSQTYEPLEIILSDDCSHDRTFEVMQEMAAAYMGSHTVVLNRNEKNLNIGRHVNKIGGCSRGQLIVLAAGDDVSRQDRVQKIVDCWLEAGKRAGLIYSDFQPIDENSNAASLAKERSYKGPHLIEEHARGNIRILGATTAVVKEVFDLFPPMLPSVIHEDRVLPFRVLLLGRNTIFINDPLVRYRVTGGVSRNTEGDLRHYIKQYVVKKTSRILPDAIQRLSDVMHAQPENVSIRHICETTIANHEAKIALSSCGFWVLEIELIRWVLRGAGVKSLIKHYLKARYISLIPGKVMAR